MSSHVQRQKTDFLDATSEFVSVHMNQLLNLFAILETGDELRLLQLTTGRLQNIHKELSLNSFSESLLFREAFQAMKKMHHRQVRQTMVQIKQYLESVGLNSSQVSRILGSDNVRFQPKTQVSIHSSKHDLTKAQEILHQMSVHYQKHVRRTKRWVRGVVVITGIVALLTGVVFIPALSQLTRTNLLIETIKSKWQHYQNPYMDWLPFEPELPTDSKLGTPDVTVIQQSSTQQPLFLANYKQAGVQIAESFIPGASNSAKSTVIQSTSSAETIAKGNIDYSMSVQGAGIKQFSKELNDMKPYKQLPDKLEYYSQTDDAKHLLSFHVEPLRLPNDFNQTGSNVVKITIPKTGKEYDIYQQSFMDSKTKTPLVVITTNNADYILKNDTNLSTERQANQGQFEVYENGKQAAIVFSHNGVQNIVYLYRDDVSWLINFAKQYLLHT